MTEALRTQLSRLMRRGLTGRNLRGVWRDLNRRLDEHNASQASWDSFLQWYDGRAFPLTQLRQKLLGEIIHGECGDAICRLQSPPFRAYARGVMLMHHVHNPRRKQREFPIVPIRDGAGRTVQKAMIVCSQCSECAYHLRRGNLDTDLYFEKEGWLVGGGPSADKCPQCRKVVHMKEHKPVKPAPMPETPFTRSQTGTDRLLIGMKIGDNFDEPEARYRSGWSDAKVAEELELPLDWVKAEREHLYPGSNGDNPDADAFVKELAALNDIHTAFEKRAIELTVSVAATETLVRQLQEAHAAVRTEHARLTADRDKFKVGLQRMLDLAETLPRPFGVRRA